MYAVIVLTFFTFYVDASKGKQVSFFYDMHVRSTDRLSKYTFFLIIVTLLGTPITLGFFLKIAVLINISMAGKLIMMTAILINLTLIIFYLQAVRHNQIQRKKKKNTTNITSDLRILSPYTSLFLLLSIFLVTLFCDIATALM